MKLPYPSATAVADPDGFLLVDKPAGITSSDVVVAIRKRFGFKKVGHGGTLDPGATGLLVLLIGKATKLSNHIMGGEKVYSGALKLGISTSTQDWEGEVTQTADPSGVTEDLLDEIMHLDFLGDIMQVPPMVSAIKINGKPLYKLARRGEEIEREPRLVHIYSISLDSFANPDATFTLRCSKGTYVRTICHDIGQRLKCGAHMTALRRLKCGSFDIANATSLEELKKMERSSLPILPITAE